jgi:hypothetical protein
MYPPDIRYTDRMVNKETPHLTIRYTPQLRLLLRLLQAKTGLTKAALVQLALVRLAELEGVERPGDVEPVQASGTQ